MSLSLKVLRCEKARLPSVQTVDSKKWEQMKSDLSFKQVVGLVDEDLCKERVQDFHNRHRDSRAENIPITQPYLDFCKADPRISKELDALKSKKPVKDNSLLYIKPNGELKIAGIRRITHQLGYLVKIRPNSSLVEEYRSYWKLGMPT